MDNGDGFIDKKRITIGIGTGAPVMLVSLLSTVYGFIPSLFVFSG